MTIQPHAFAQAIPITMMPGIEVDDPLAAYWLCQVTLRVRREIAWLWHQRGLLAGAELAPTPLPVMDDPTGDVLDRARFDAERGAFFSSDATARHLSTMIDAPAGPASGAAATGSFSDLVRRLELEPHHCLVLALALAQRIDSSIGTAFAACLNVANRSPATLALAQRLWARPQEIFRCLDASDRLARSGILAPVPVDWDSPLEVPAAIARQLLFQRSDDSSMVRIVAADIAAGRRIVDRSLVTGRLRSAARQSRLTVVAVSGMRDAPLEGAAAALAADLGLELVAPVVDPPPAQIPTLLTLAWLKGAAVYLEGARLAPDTPLPDLPLLVLAGVEDAGSQRHVEALTCDPAVALRPLTHGERLAVWQAGLPAAQSDLRLAEALHDCARRFRSDSRAIERRCAALRAQQPPLAARDLHAACRADLQLGGLAQLVPPRFNRDELMLSPQPAAKIDVIIQAMRALARVHYDWGLARAWNEAGLAVLFSGAPGTGKTMAAEVIADAVDLPLYRIDLSQVVSKYIGETEKNLARLFDAADAADVILFFDEADALFGKRSEVKDSHDRYANLEISYLLERMERFKGLAILASNRKKDLDEAFLRRLRFIVDFPLPGPAERARIWRLCLPAGVDADDVDLDFLAQRLPLTGGHIRSIIFNACLQTARAGSGRKLTMASVVQAARDEMEKLGRTINLDQFGPYSRHLGNREDGP
jgi:hypothetical protein